MTTSVAWPRAASVTPYHHLRETRRGSGAYSFTPLRGQRTSWSCPRESERMNDGSIVRGPGIVVVTHNSNRMSALAPSQTEREIPL
ncbi:hypothetical protein KOW79_001464 [Hemibagrus wyckioides]|uniref:Uncharacterized protein n=1 Tax=Hemibagrus wyckioides TaxID=337641 RepID=A0A9D3P571_9TELE|nr:hypothetical protein KOW79_001464 [Hemibagrus wyckioides]